MSYVTGRTIRELREKRKLTQKELAEKISVSHKTISKWETGKDFRIWESWKTCQKPWEYRLANY